MFFLMLNFIWLSLVERYNKLIIFRHIQMHTLHSYERRMFMQDHHYYIFIFISKDSIFFDFY